VRSTATNICPLCGGNKTPGTTTFTVDLKDTLVVVRNVPATLCSLCGNEWLADDVAASLESIVEDAKRRNHLVEVTQFRKVA
jgi:YgiT-type zinc finger domain-containing protein